jgi:hypothetical protein
MANSFGVVCKTKWTGLRIMLYVSQILLPSFYLAIIVLITYHSTDKTGNVSRMVAILVQWRTIELVTSFRNYK